MPSGPDSPENVIRGILSVQSLAQAAIVGAASSFTLNGFAVPSVGAFASQALYIGGASVAGTAVVRFAEPFVKLQSVPALALAETGVTLGILMGLGVVPVQFDMSTVMLAAAVAGGIYVADMLAADGLP